MSRESSAAKRALPVRARSSTKVAATPMGRLPSPPVSSSRAPTTKRPTTKRAGRAAPRIDPIIAEGRKVLAIEAKAIASVGPRLDASFTRAVELLSSCKGHIVVTGMGKPGYIAQNLSAILASVGTPSLYLHPADAVHGDLGRVTARDVLLALSNSGKTEELLRLIPSLRKIGARLIAVTGDGNSPLARAADVSLDIGRIDEACPMGLVPTASSAALHAICDALAMTLLKARSFTNEEYAIYHPGGALGRRVMKVRELMRSGEQNPVIGEREPLHRAVAIMTNTPGRPGATSVVDKKGALVGIFTDGDLRRLVERGSPDFSRPIGEVMVKRPRTCGPDDLVQKAAALMREAKIDQLPVVDAKGKSMGFLDIQDLLAARFL